MDTQTTSRGLPYAKSRFSEAERLAIAAAIKKHMAEEGIARKSLVNEKLKLKIGIINKALIGGFSDETLFKLEIALGCKFTPDSNVRLSPEAPKALGGYSREDVSDLEGDYLCLRPIFANPRVFTSYKITLTWDDRRNCLRFFESDRFDGRYTQAGDVYNPPKKPFFNLVTADLGTVRLMSLSVPDECGVSRGVLTTLSNPHGAIFTPASTPVVLIKAGSDNLKHLGLIKPESELYEKARELIESVISEEYVQFVTNLKTPVREHEFAI